MKISVDGKEIFVLSDVQKKVLANDINSDILFDDICRRLKWVIMHKYEQSFKRLKNEWDQKLPDNDVYMVPTDKDQYALLVFSQYNYTDAKSRSAPMTIDNQSDLV